MFAYYIVYERWVFVSFYNFLYRFQVGFFNSKRQRDDFLHMKISGDSRSESVNSFGISTPVFLEH